MHKIITALILAMISQWSAAQEITLLTCGAGDEVYSTFGHSALRVKDQVRGYDRVYNYGTFDFQTPGFLLKFMRGKLPYRLSVSRFEDFMYAYRYEERNVIEQKLQLSAEDKSELLRLLRINMQPENREYAYDFFFDNCSTRILDLLKLTPGNLQYANEPKQITFREMLKPNLINMPWSEFGIDLIIGAKADQLANRDQQMFLPEYLSNYLAEASSEEQNIMKEPEVLLLYADKQAQRKIRPFITPVKVLAVFCLLFLLIRIRYFKQVLPRWISIVDKSYLFLIGLLGIIMLIMWFATDHQACGSNWNVIWANPLLLLVLWSKGAFRRNIIYLLLALQVIALFNVAFGFLPMYFHPAFICLIFCTIIALVSILSWSQKPANMPA